MADKLAKEGALMTREKTELKNGFKTIINEIEDILFKEHVKNIKRTKIIERNKKNGTGNTKKIQNIQTNNKQ